MPNKNSIESEIDKDLDDFLLPSWLRGYEPYQITISGKLTDDPRAFVLPYRTFKKGIEAIIQREVKKGRVEELKRNAYYSQPRKTDPLKLCGIDMTAKQVLDRLEELEG